MADHTIVVEKITEIKEVYTLRDDWNLLIHTYTPNAIELTFEWQIDYWKNVSEHSELFILVIKKNAQIAAVAPLHITNEKILGLKVRTLKIIAATESNYQNFIIGDTSQEITEAALKFIYKHKNTWDVFRISKIAKGKQTAEQSQHFCKTQHLPCIIKEDTCAYLKIGSDWQTYQNNLDSKRKHRVKNRMRKAARELGELKLKHSKYPSEYIGDVEIFFKLHQKRWDQTDTPSQFNQPEMCEFYREAGAHLMAKGHYNLYTLKAGWKTLGQLIAFLTEQYALIQIIAYDPDYSTYSPMIILMELFVKEVYKQGIHTIDWGTYYDWKELWTNQTKPRLHMELYSNKIRSRMTFLFTKTYYFAKQTAKKSEYLTNIYRNWRKSQTLTNIT